MYRGHKDLDIRLRLTEMNRRSAELSAVSSKLADMAAQLDRLRKLNERIWIFAGCGSPSGRRRDNDSLLGRYLGDSRRRIELSRNLADKN